MTQWALILVVLNSSMNITMIPMVNLKSCLEAKEAYEKKYYKIDGSCTNVETGEVIFKRTVPVIGY